MTQQEIKKLEKRGETLRKLLKGALTKVEMSVVDELIEIELELEAECNK